MELPPAFASPGRVVLLRVGSANYRCTVFVDGQPIGSHEGARCPAPLTPPAHRARERQRTRTPRTLRTPSAGGHLPFQFDVSAAAAAAAAGRRPLVLALMVDGSLSPTSVPPGGLAQRPVQVRFAFAGHALF